MCVYMYMHVQRNCAPITHLTLLHVRVCCGTVSCYDAGDRCFSFTTKLWRKLDLKVMTLSLNSSQNSDSVYSYSDSVC